MNYHDLVNEELKRADEKHGPMMGLVEGLHTLKCEIAEFEREVMRENRNEEALQRELIQVGAMALKLWRDKIFLPLSTVVRHSPKSILIKHKEIFYAAFCWDSDKYAIYSVDGVVEKVPALECEVVYDPWNVAL